MNGLLEKLDASIEALMPPHEAAARRAAREKEAAERAKARETVRKEASHAIEALAAAIRAPMIARSDLQHAHECIRKAMVAVDVLDPEYCE